MNEYHKINSVFMRDPATKHKTFLISFFSEEAFEYLQYLTWIGTEKIDGTNIRIHWDGASVKFGGRSKDAQIPAPLLSALQNRFTPEKMAAGTKGPVTLYGEGYGSGIQKGGERYRSDVGFILFDAYSDIWLQRGALNEISESLKIPIVPEVFKGTLWDAISYVSSSPRSVSSRDVSHKMEGLVLRPAVDLHDRRGRRIITKLKARDFQHMQCSEKG